jgi:hypothetical protein
MIRHAIKGDYLRCHDGPTMSLNEFGADIQVEIELLKRKRVLFEPGLSNSEVKRVEEVFCFIFPPDLRAFLQTAIPIHVDSDRGGNVFPNWRAGEQTELQGRLDWPFDGIAFDIENCGFWLEEWGNRPANLADAIQIAKEHVRTAPTLIPLCSHRYLPASPLLAGNPVFSVYQTDIIVYGRNLWDYFLHEFDQQKWLRANEANRLAEDEFHDALREIHFWTKLSG